MKPPIPESIMNKPIGPNPYPVGVEVFPPTFPMAAVPPLAEAVPPLVEEEDRLHALPRLALAIRLVAKRQAHTAVRQFIGSMG